MADRVLRMNASRRGSLTARRRRPHPRQNPPTPGGGWCYDSGRSAFGDGGPPPGTGHLLGARAMRNRRFPLSRWRDRFPRGARGGAAGRRPGAGLADLHEGHRADLAGQVRGVSPARVDCADVAAHVRRDAPVGPVDPHARGSPADAAVAHRQDRRRAGVQERSLVQRRSDCDHPDVGRPGRAGRATRATCPPRRCGPPSRSGTSPRPTASRNPTSSCAPRRGRKRPAPTTRGGSRLSRPG